jgi:predicted RNA methylase
MVATFQVSDEVRAILDRATIDRMHDGTFTLMLHEGQLDRKLYLDVNKVLEGAGGKWEKKFKWHRFSGDPRPLIGRAIQTGKGTNEQQRLGSFYTPDDLADRLVSYANSWTQKWPDPSPFILEPSVGGGALVRAIFRGTPFCRVVGYDVDEVAIKKLEEEKNPYLTLMVKDFLSIEPAPHFDQVVMNPPFAKGQDVDHVLHAIEFLKPGGVLASIMAGNAATKEDKRHRAFRSVLSCEMNGWDCQEVPAGTFRESGTDVSTLMLVTKKYA